MPGPRFARTALAITALAALGLAHGAGAQTVSPARMISGFAHPESVLIGPEMRYVSNIGAKLDALGHDGDGFISLLDARGRIVDLQAFTGLDAPKGMALLDGRLYVADIDRVVGFDLESHRQVFAATMHCAAPCLLNDIAVQGDRLLITDTLRGQLYALDPRTGVFALLAEGVPGANGIIWDAGHARAMIVAVGADFSGGDLFTWSVAEGLRKIPASPKRIFDGISQLPDGRILVSDWRSLTPTPGAFLSVDPDIGESHPVDLGLPIRGPADFAFDAAGDTLWIPATVDGAVIVTPLP